jgi:hypothetical protein
VDDLTLNVPSMQDCDAVFEDLLQLVVGEPLTLAEYVEARRMYGALLEICIAASESRALSPIIATAITSFVKQPSPIDIEKSPC